MAEIDDGLLGWRGAGRLWNFAGNVGHCTRVGHVNDALLILSLDAGREVDVEDMADGGAGNVVADVLEVAIACRLRQGNKTKVNGFSLLSRSDIFLQRNTQRTNQFDCASEDSICE